MKNKLINCQILLLFLLGISSLSTAQEDLAVNDNSEFIGNASLVYLPPPYPTGGNFELGLRSTLSLFGSDEGSGSGVGGQFRIRFSNRINTEWFADMITTNLGNIGRRIDGHIGWSVMFYLSNYSYLDGSFKGRFTPYILAGHCFDYTKITGSDQFQNNSHIFGERWSSAVQMGAGTHFALTPRCDLSLSAQYMLHLGGDMHGVVEEVNGLNQLTIETENEAGLEGHLLTTLSINYKIADLW